MKKSTRIRFIIMTLIVISMVITVLSSCSADNSSPILCNVKLDYDNSRDFGKPSLISKLTDTTLFYKSNYLGSGSSYGSTTDYVSYPDGGLILSQGLWQIDCKWMKGDTLIAEGTTRDIWVNLNTSSILVYLEENVGKGSFSLESYKVKCSDNSVSSVSYDISLCKYTESLGSNLLSTSEYKTGKETGCISTLNITKNDLEAGAYLLTIKVFNGNTQTTENLLFTDVLGFLVREGHQTSITGECYVIKGSSGSNEYLTWEPKPENPSTETSNVLPVGGDTTDSSGKPIPSGSLNDPELKLADKTVIIINKDNDSTKQEMSLGHTHDNNNQSNRIITPNGGTAEVPIRFGINLNGTDVVLSTLDLGFSSESSAIINLPLYSEMTIYNNCYNKREATWAKMNTTPIGDRRYEANVMLQGGTLNVVGTRDRSISNASIVFQGPLHTDVDNYETIGWNQYQKQGSINVYSPGGSIVLDGEVSLIGSTGISSWSTKKSEGTTISGNVNTNITLKNNAKILATGDSHSEFSILLAKKVDCSDTAYGIKLVGDTTSTGTINIELDNGHIKTSNVDKTDTNEVGIYIENFAGNININLKNGSSIETSGTAIKLVKCTGSITINVEKGCTISALTQLNKNGATSSLI